MWVCHHSGYPAVPLPGANVWFQDSDSSDPDSGVVCHQITEAELLRDVVRWGRVALRIAVALGG